MDTSHFTKDGHPIYGKATFEEHMLYRQREIERRCVYFTNLSQGRCLAGVAYWPQGPQPCLLDYDNGTHVCELRRFPDADTARAQAIERHREIEALLNEMTTRMTNKQCLHCGVAFTRLRQVGHCVYAEPCGHRQYQGRVPKEA